MRNYLLPIAIVALLPFSARAQSDCSDGTRYDDGVFESGDGLNATNVARGGVMQLMEASSYPSKVNSVCLCWLRNGSQSTVHFDIGVWASVAGSAGPLLGVVSNLQADQVPVFAGATSGKFYRFDLSSANIVASGPVIIGPIWRPRQDAGFFVCNDQTAASNKLRLEFVSGASDDSIATPTGPANLFNGAYALGIRAVFGPPSNCVSSDTAMCLQNGRFKVEATFQVNGQPVGTAHAVKLTADTGYLWFFQDTNVETVVKVLDACSFNQKFWVFAGGLTNVQVTLTVTDTMNGTVKTYTNPQGKAFQPIQDTSAFATCP